MTDEQKPVAWMWHDVAYDLFSKKFPTGQEHLFTPLYTHPAPDVVKQLVDALRMVMDDPDALDGRPRTYEYIQKALTAAKEAGL